MADPSPPEYDSLGSNRSWPTALRRSIGIGFARTPRSMPKPDPRRTEDPSRLVFRFRYLTVAPTEILEPNFRPYPRSIRLSPKSSSLSSNPEWYQSTAAACVGVSGKRNEARSSLRPEP